MKNASGLIVPEHARKSEVPVAKLSMAELRREFFTRLPKADDDGRIDPAEAALGIECCKLIIANMRLLARHNMDFNALRDAATATAELNLHIGALRQMASGVRKIYKPGEL